MMSLVFRSIFLALALSLATIAASCARGDGPMVDKEGRETLVVAAADGAEHRFRVEVADEVEERRVGLMYRTELAPDAGMLFDFGEPQMISMWMKNTLIPLDMIFIDSNGVIVRIAAMTTPQSLESISSGAPVVAVLELAGGEAERRGIRPGDRVRHRMFSGR